MDVCMIFFIILGNFDAQILKICKFKQMSEFYCKIELKTESHKIVKRATKNVFVKIHAHKCSHEVEIHLMGTCVCTDFYEILGAYVSNSIKIYTFLVEIFAINNFN